MIYFDAAYVAKFYLDEPESEAVRALAESSGAVACCAFGQVETMSVFHRRLRVGQWDAKVFAAVCGQFQQDCAALVWTWLPVTLPLLELTTKRLCALPPNVFVRAGDALHLTCAIENGFREIHSNDRHVLIAAAHFGLRPSSV